MSEIEETRAIVERGETYEGSVIPTRKAEIERPVTVKPGATVTEGAYGQTVSVGAGATVDGPVMGKQAVEVTDGVVRGDVGTAGKVETESATVHGTVTATRLRLVDTTVVGNVVAQQATLEDCTVVGTVVGERSLRLEGTTCYTFKSYTEGTIADSRVLLPQAVADGSTTLESPVSVRSIRRKERFVEGDDDRFPTLTRTDVEVVDGTRYLTLVPRLLDLEAVETRLEQLEEFLRAVELAQYNRTAFDPPGDAEWVLDAIEVDPSVFDFDESE